MIWPVWSLSWFELAVVYDFSDRLTIHDANKSLFFGKSELGCQVVGYLSVGLAFEVVDFVAVHR